MWKLKYNNLTCGAPAPWLEDIKKVEDIKVTWIKMYQTDMSSSCPDVRSGRLLHTDYVLCRLLTNSYVTSILPRDCTTLYKYDWYSIYSSLLFGPQILSATQSNTLILTAWWTTLRQILSCVNYHIILSKTFLLFCVPYCLIFLI
jgi:hypothetical protein